MTGNDGDYREGVLRCIRCGYCTPGCPILEHLRWEGAGPRGKMMILRAMHDGHLDAGQNVLERLAQCTTCGHCQEGCVTGLDVSSVFEAARYDLAQRGLLLDAHREMGKRVRDTNNPYGESAGHFPKGDDESMDALFIGCTYRYRRPRAFEAIERLAPRLGIATVSEEVCCGSPLLRTGQRELACEFARRNFEVFSDYRKIVTTCAGCAITLTRDYPKMGFEMPVTELTGYLLDRGDLDLKLDEPVKLAYHDPCHLGRGLDVYEEPRMLLGSVENLELVEMETRLSDSTCCGGGGGVASGFPELSAMMAKKRVAEAKKTGADGIVTSCPLCANNLSKGGEMKVLDVWEVMDMAISEND